MAHDPVPSTHRRSVLCGDYLLTQAAVELHECCDPASGFVTGPGRPRHDDGTKVRGVGIGKGLFPTQGFSFPEVSLQLMSVGCADPCRSLLGVDTEQRRLGKARVEGCVDGADILSVNNKYYLHSQK